MFFSSHSYTGEYRKSITVTSNDPKHRSQSLKCHGRVRLPVVFSPRTVDFGALNRSHPTQYKTITVERGDGGPIAPEVTLGKLKGLDAQVCEIEKGEKYELVLSLSPPFATGRLRERLFIDTGVEGAPKQALRVIGRVKPRLAAKPKQFAFPAKRTEATTMSLNLEWDEKPGKILSAECSIPDAKLELEEKGKKVALQLTMPAGDEGYPGRQSVTIKTDDEEVPVMSVGVVFRHKRPSGPGRARDNAAIGRRGGKTRPSRIIKPK